MMLLLLLLVLLLMVLRVVVVMLLVMLLENIETMLVWGALLVFSLWCGTINIAETGTLWDHDHSGVR